jgi:hypothetical protein
MHAAGADVASAVQIVSSSKFILLDLIEVLLHTVETEEANLQIHGV